MQFFAEDFQLPQIHQSDLIFEREIARNTVVSASYLGSFGNSLPNFVDTNLNPPTTFVNLNVSGGPFARSSIATASVCGTEAEPELRGTDGDSQRRFLEVSRVGASSQSSSDGRPAIPGELHAFASL